ncbi:hypothetical protein [Pseudofrankia sp. DC12]|uniref:hypothetical protein n=1 Tax=Pseudofrankia sp. DC12 TaxID=683315 RepID=UPI00069866A3|nr:hypothetical protein [Pseudofrankia sp. DC12]
MVISYTYRTLVRQDGRLIKIDVEQPTRGLTGQLDYRNAGVQHVRLLDFFASSNHARIMDAPESVPEQTIREEFGWGIAPVRGGAGVEATGAEPARSINGPVIWPSFTTSTLRLRALP